jgi:hypothetical protein
MGQGMQFFVDQRDQGLEGLLVSSPPFHQQFADSFRRQLRQACSPRGLGWLQDSLALKSSQFPGAVEMAAYIPWLASQAVLFAEQLNVLGPFSFRFPH